METKRITYVVTYEADIPEDMDIDMVRDQLETEQSLSDFTIHVAEYAGDNAHREVFFSEADTECYVNPESKIDADNKPDNK